MSWKEALEPRTSRHLTEEIDVFERELELRKVGRLEEKLFAETRLRRGVYGQRYDNGQRHDGIETRTIPFPSGELTKGPMTMWDAPGMQRLKIPYGGMTAEQLEVMAELADEYSDGIAHITTRQDFQLHFIHIEDTPDLMRRLAAVGITTKEACGNSVRNITACPRSGVCRGEIFDVTAYARELGTFLMGHPDTQDFGRKFKIAFSGCRDEACGLVRLHDMGALAVIRDGKRGFELFVGGGLGSVPHQAHVFEEFVSEEELFPLSQAIARVFARLGEKQNRARARVKFLVAKLGIDEFRRLVREERAKLPADPRWTEYVARVHAPVETPMSLLKLHRSKNEARAFTDWQRTNVYAQRQEGYSLVTVRCPLGDLTSAQLRGLADLARSFCGDTIRLTVEQNVVLRWVQNEKLPAVYEGLVSLGLGSAGAETLKDITSCPGTDTCKLGISASRGLAAELSRSLDELDVVKHEAVEGLRIKTSGCFNSCGQHHVADMGFLGVSRNVNGRRVPHFQVVLGGQWKNNAGAYGLTIGAVPSKRVPAVVKRLTEGFVAERADDESFQAYIQRKGKAALRKSLEDLIEVQPYADAPELYRDWGDPREYTIGDMGVGECAGEVVPFVEFGLAAAEREVLDASTLLERGELSAARDKSLHAMLVAAQALVRHVGEFVSDEPSEIVAKFRSALVETKLFWDPFAGDKFAFYFFRSYDHANENIDADGVRRHLEEASLFVDAGHQAYGRIEEGKRQAAAAAKAEKGGAPSTGAA